MKPTEHLGLRSVFTGAVSFSPPALMRDGPQPRPCLLLLRLSQTLSMEIILQVRLKSKAWPRSGLVTGNFVSPSIRGCFVRVSRFLPHINRNNISVRLWVTWCRHARCGMPKELRELAKKIIACGSKFLLPLKQSPFLCTCGRNRPVFWLSRGPGGLYKE